MGRSNDLFRVLFILLMIVVIPYSVSQINVFPDFFKENDVVFFSNEDSQYLYSAKYVTTSPDGKINYPKLGITYTAATYVKYYYIKYS